MSYLAAKHSASRRLIRRPGGALGTFAEGHSASGTGGEVPLLDRVANMFDSVFGAPATATKPAQQSQASLQSEADAARLGISVTKTFQKANVEISKIAAAEQAERNRRFKIAAAVAGVAVIGFFLFVKRPRASASSAPLRAAPGGAL